ncbi:neural cell adhesion molecule 2-like isoform X2 [Haliotis asinina]|uniref:neural cell adhesion molecule 2-like isoform X2 n=1 Tax=Haliotis asinina TaxID=109174 RepID=UPI00353210BD
MDLSITPVVLSLLLIGISYAQEIKLSPDAPSIRRETNSKGLVLYCEAIGLADDQNANLEWLDKADNVIGPYNPAEQSRIYSMQMGNSNRLQFDTLKNGDEGTYTCRGTIGGNTLTKDIQLNLYDGIKVTSNRTQQPNIHTDAVIKCEATANPAPTVQWLFGNRSAVRGDRYKQLDNGLEIKNITQADNGVYICLVTVQEMFDSLPFDITVKVTVPPSLKGPPTRSKPIVGKRFEMTCVADGTPPPSFTFKKDNIVLSGERYKVSIVNDVKVNQGILVIEELQDSDEGTYSCVAHNQGGNVTESVFINTIVPPIIEPIVNQSEPEGNAVELACVAKGDPAPTVTWRIKGSDITISDSPDEGISIESSVDEQPLIKVKTVKLKFAKLEPKHANNYTCSASNEAGTQEKDGRVLVEFKPNFADTPYSSTYSWLNQKTEIKCVANAVPIAVIKWKHNDAIINEGPNFKITSERGVRQITSILEVSVNVENEKNIFGKFTCIAENFHGESEYDITLLQAVVPSAPSISIDGVSPTTIDLLITPHQETGGQPIIDYKVVYYAEGDEQNKVTRMAPVSANAQELRTRFLIDNLSAQVTYYISVEARNNVGYGAAAEVADTTPAVRQPSSPKVTSTRSSDHPNTYKLAWEKPETGGKPLTGYKVKYYQVELKADDPEKVEKVVGEMITKTIDNGDTTEISLTELMPNSAYELQITAINAIGESMATNKIFTTPPGGLPNTGKTEGMATAAIIGILIAIIILLFLVIDVTFYFTKQCGLLWTIKGKVTGGEAGGERADAEAADHEKEAFIKDGKLDSEEPSAKENVDVVNETEKAGEEDKMKELEPEDKEEKPVTESAEEVKEEAPPASSPQTESPPATTADSAAESAVPQPQGEDKDPKV